MKNCKTNKKIVIFSVYGHHSTLFYQKIYKYREKKNFNFFALGGVVIQGLKGGKLGGSRLKLKNRRGGATTNPLRCSRPLSVRKLMKPIYLQGGWLKLLLPPLLKIVFRLYSFVCLTFLVYWPCFFPIHRLALEKKVRRRKDLLPFLILPHNTNQVKFKKIL